MVTSKADDKGILERAGDAVAGAAQVVSTSAKLVAKKASDAVAA